MEESKFTGALAKLRQLSVQESAVEEPPVALETSRESRGRGRPRSKSSDPDYQSTTVILRKKTKRTAARILEDEELGKDLSELIEELLTDWIKRHS